MTVVWKNNNGPEGFLLLNLGKWLYCRFLVCYVTWSLAYRTNETTKQNIQQNAAEPCLLGDALTYSMTVYLGVWWCWFRQTYCAASHTECNTCKVVHQTFLIRTVNSLLYKVFIMLYFLSVFWRVFLQHLLNFTAAHVEGSASMMFTQWLKYMSLLSTLGCSMTLNSLFLKTL